MTMTQGQAEAEMRIMARDERVMPVQREAIAMALSALAQSRARGDERERIVRLERRVSALERMHQPRPTHDPDTPESENETDTRERELADAVRHNPMCQPSRLQQGPPPTREMIQAAAVLLLGVAWDAAEAAARSGDLLAFTAWARTWVAMLLVRDYPPGTTLGEGDEWKERRQYHIGIASAPIGLRDDPEPETGGDALLTMMYG